MQGQGQGCHGQEEVSMPTKVTDCIFMGDDIIAHDIEWLTLNQITHIVNCAGRHSQNNTTVKGMCFLTFDWSQNSIQTIIDQSVISAVFGFIEEARREQGTVLVHGWHSESRPFCLLAVYFMIKYQWNIFKALEYLNSRREGTEIDEGFINQLNTLNAHLLERGLIRSKQWAITAETSEEEIVLTNTFLNSRKRPPQEAMKTGKRRKKLKTLNWKENLSVEHVYSSSTVIAQLNQPTRPSPVEQKPRSDSIKSRKQEEQQPPKSITGKILVAKQALRADKASSILTEMNVTRKWNELRESWMKEKENLNNQPTGTVSRGADTPLYLKKEQRINDRLQDKISILKAQAHSQDTIKPPQPQLVNKDSSAALLRKARDEPKKEEAKKDKEKEKGLLGLLASEEGRESRIVHNNWIINNQPKEGGLKNQKQTSNKSVIVVKPNHALQPADTNQPPRSSVRKVGSQRKPQKQQNPSRKFFGDENAGPAQRGRCNSVKQQRKEGLGSSLIMKNNSLAGKGKWKM